ncbi:MAG: sulfite exporter TauE/SafE family protein, partial [Roseinatronobacter sp.]|nr:sulfite exporter TauE/SafE family protein [Roseinatronobacter sp.]
LVGVFTAERLFLSAIALPAAIAGMWLGNRMVARVPAQKFRALFLEVLGCLGLNLVWRGLTGG